MNETSEHTGVISVLTSKGDEPKATWNHRNADQVEIARRTFEHYKSKGYAAFKMDEQNRKGDQIREFEPMAERILFVPAIAGGE